MNPINLIVPIFVLISRASAGIPQNSMPKASESMAASRDKQINYINKFINMFGDSSFALTSKTIESRRNEIFYRGSTQLHPSGACVLLSFDDNGSGKIVRIDFASVQEDKIKMPFIISHDYNYFKLCSERMNLKFQRELDFCEVTQAKLEKTELPSLLFEEMESNGLMKLKSIILTKIYKNNNGTTRGWIKINDQNKCVAASFGEDLGDNPGLSPLIVYMAP